ncbi:MAG: ACP S-malonyltransferase [Paracoccaceae bacterium]
MKQTAVVIAPGRGTYNRNELGYLARHHSDKGALVARFDAFRSQQGQPTITELDTAAQFSGAVHTRGDNASALIHACAYADFLSIDRDRFDILGVTGNSMGWYIALTCAGALSPLDGLNVVNTMGTLMQNAMLGGQIVYPFVDENWVPVPGRRRAILDKLREINARAGRDLGLSIDLGGMIVIAGSEQGLTDFEAEMPRLDGRYPMRLPNHAAFHTDLQAPVAQQGQDRLPQALFTQPTIPLIDGRAGQWLPKSSNLEHLRTYTLGHQVTESYDFTRAVQSAAFELMPDVIIVLGPGATLGGAAARSLIQKNWRGMATKSDFTDRQQKDPVLISMGREDQRHLAT